MLIKDYTNEQEELILKKAKNAIGLTIEEIYRQSNIDVSTLNLKNKGNIGNIIEEKWFGIKNNNSSLPDFQASGIELKVIPLIEKKNSEFSIKERTKICSINYNELIKEEWESSHAKVKLQKILFIYYIYNKNNIIKSMVKKIDLFELKGPNSLLIKADWNKVQNYVKKGHAHLISESISKILAASRSGSGGKKDDGTSKDLVSQPNTEYEPSALKRAFSLKTSFTNQLWNELNNNNYESIIENLNLDSFNFEEKLLEKLRNLENETIDKIAEMFDIHVPNGKNAIATIIKKSIGFKNVNSRIKEFEQLGITVKTISTKRNYDNKEKDYYPLEAVSFPTFKLKELIKENFYEGEEDNEYWEQCTLLNEINRILFIPILKENDIDEKRLGKAFFWSPSELELDVIEEEWNNYINEINSGKVKVTKKPYGNSYKEVSGLSKESDTQIIHVRPHGKDRSDRDIDHLGNSIVKQSFWLNKKFLQKLLKKNYS